MVLADSVEPLHYPTIMFSSPLAPPLLSSLPSHVPSLPPTPHTPQPPPSIILLLPFPYPFSLTWLFPPVLLFIAVDSSSSLLHVFILSLSVSLYVHVSVSLSSSLSISLTPFHWSYYFFCVSCFPLIIFTFICQFALIYWLYCHDFLTETILPKQNQLCKSIKQYFMHSKPIKMINHSILIQGLWKNCI